MEDFQKKKPKGQQKLESITDMKVGTDLDILVFCPKALFNHHFLLLSFRHLWITTPSLRKCQARCQSTWPWLVSCHAWWVRDNWWRYQRWSRSWPARMTIPMHNRSDIRHWVFTTSVLSPSFDLYIWICVECKAVPAEPTGEWNWCCAAGNAVRTAIWETQQQYPAQPYWGAHA